MADDDPKPDLPAPDQQPAADAPEAGSAPPPLSSATDGETPPTDTGGSPADSMESNLPNALKGGAASVALGQGTITEKEEKTFAMLAHILGFFPLIGPLIIWLLYREKSPFVDDQGKEAVQFQFLLLIAWVVVGVLNVIPLVQCFAWLLIPALWIVQIIMVILAGLKAGDGVAYRYPWALRIL